MLYARGGAWLLHSRLIVCLYLIVDSCASISLLKTTTSLVSSGLKLASAAATYNVADVISALMEVHNVAKDYKESRPMPWYNTVRVWNDLAPDALFNMIKNPLVNVEPAHVTYFVIEMLDRIARTPTTDCDDIGAESESKVGASEMTGGSSSLESVTPQPATRTFDPSAVTKAHRVLAMELMSEIYRNARTRLEIKSAGDELRVHILCRLRRLCTLPGGGVLLDTAKQELREVFQFAEPPSCWAGMCCGGSSVGTIAEQHHRFVYAASCMLGNRSVFTSTCTLCSIVT